MINSTTEDTSSNKRSRMGHSTAKWTRAAFFGSAAAASTNLASTLGLMIKPIMDILAMQPTELKGAIISQSMEMLDLHTTIRQRMKSHTPAPKSHQPMPPPVPPNTIKQATTFLLSNSIWSKSPIKASALTNNDIYMRTILEKAETAHAKYATTVTAYAPKKQASWKLPPLRTRQLRHIFFILAETIALLQMIILKVKNGVLPPNVKLDHNELTAKTTFCVLMDDWTDICTTLGVDSGANMLADFATLWSFWWFSNWNKNGYIGRQFYQPCHCKDE